MPDATTATWPAPRFHPSAQPLMELMRAAGIDPTDFCEAYEENWFPKDIAAAAAIDARFRTWLRVNASEHPFLRVQLMTVIEALTAAGIDSHEFSPEGICEGHPDRKRPVESAKWFGWLRKANAMHREGWGDDQVGFAEDICRAIDAKASILVSARWG